MNRSELIEAVAAEADLSKAAADRALTAVISAITKAAAKGEGTTLVGFGSFSVRRRAAREGKNPKTGEKLKIAARNAFVFKASGTMADKVAKAKVAKK